MAALSESSAHSIVLAARGTGAGPEGGCQVNEAVVAVLGMCALGLGCVGPGPGPGPGRAQRAIELYID